jgi:signal transduction histidine kinase
MRLRTKFAVVLVVVTLLLSGGVFAGLELFKQQTVAETQANVDGTAALAASQVDDRVRELRDRVGLQASRARAAQFDRSDRYLDTFLRTADPAFYAAQVVAANGTLLSYRGAIDRSVRQEAVGSDRSDRPYVRAGLDNETYVGDPQTDGTGRYFIVVSAPIFEDGETKGVFVAAVRLQAGARTGTSTEVPGVFDGLSAIESDSRSVRVTAGNETLRESSRRFEQSIRASAAVPTTGWTVTVARDRAGLNARLEQLALSQGVGLGLVLFLMVGFGYWQYTASLRQTEQLLDGFDQLEAGNYDYTVALRGGEEWERISAGVNGLAAGLREREAALRERQQRLEVLYRLLRHNLRNGMSVINTHADLLAERTDDPLLAESAGAIAEAGEELSDLSWKARQLEQLLDEAEPAAEPLDLASVAADVIDEQRERYTGVSFELSIPEEAPVVAVPSLRFAVENAVENACEHNDSADPEVSVAVRRVSGTAGNGHPGVELVVADNGPGIPEQDRAVIEQGRETDLEHGSGLGLWIVYWIVDSSGGELAFEENDPRGSVVRLRLRAPGAADREETPAVGTP